MYCLTAPGAGIPRSRTWSGLVPTENCKGEAVPFSLAAASGLLAVSGISWLVEASLGLCLHSHMTFSLCL